MKGSLQPPVIAAVTSTSCSLFSCCCCPCLYVKFFNTRAGILKMIELILGGLCHSIFVFFGSSPALTLSLTGTSLQNVNFAYTFTVTLLVVCYFFSQRSFHLVRMSIFEVLFNTSAAVSYFFLSLGIVIATKLYLEPLNYLTAGWFSNSSTTAAYIVGFALAFVYALDTYFCFRQFTGL